MKTSKAKSMKTSQETTTNLKLLEMVRLEPPTTKEGLMQLCQATTRTTIERDAAQLKLDRRVLDLREAHEPMIEAMNAEIDRAVKLMEIWAVANEEAEFEGRQGIDVAGSTLEFREGTGRVQVEGNEEDVLDRLLSLPESQQETQRALIQVKCTLNKRAMLALAKTGEGAAFLKSIGVIVVKERVFKFTPAREDLTPITTVMPHLRVVA